MRKPSILRRKKTAIQSADNAHENQHSREFQYARQLLDETRGEIGRADQKASVLLASVGLAISALSAAIVHSSWRPTQLGGFIAWLWWLGVAMAVLGIVFFGRVVYPRSTRIAPEPGTPVSYFGDVVGYSTTQQLMNVVSKSEHTDLERIYDQIRQFSLLTARKYRFIRHGMLLLAGSAVCGTAAPLLSQWIG